jgi:hypothetical protein
MMVTVSVLYQLITNDSACFHLSHPCGKFDIKKRLYLGPKPSIQEVRSPLFIRGCHSGSVVCIPQGEHQYQHGEGIVSGGSAHQRHTVSTVYGYHNFLRRRCGTSLQHNTAGITDVVSS